MHFSQSVLPFVTLFPQLRHFTMGRPIYESETDIRNQEHVKRELERAWKYYLQPLSHHQILDYAARKPDTNEIHAFVEVKCRSFAWGDYPDVMLSASKFEKTQELYRTFKVRTMLVVADRNRDIRYLNIQKLNDTISIPLEYGGRTRNTRDSGDIEMIVRFPIPYFTPLNN